MKLSKEDLIYALWFGSDHREDGLAAAAEALVSGTLEIEGYVRADHFADVSNMVEEWTKFDPEDKKTFPPDGQDVIFINGEHFSMGYVFRGSVYCDKGFTPTHWQPLPKPPVESEV